MDELPFSKAMDGKNNQNSGNSDSLTVRWAYLLVRAKAQREAKAQRVMTSLASWRTFAPWRETIHEGIIERKTGLEPATYSLGKCFLYQTEL